MIRSRFILLFSFGLPFAFATAVQAESDESFDANAVFTDASSEHVDLHRGNWDFGIHFGFAKPIGNRSMSIAANNSAFAVSDPGSLGEDEFGENGLPLPDLAGQTQLLGDMNSSYLVGAQLYYKLTPWVSTGLEGSYAIENSVDITVGGPFLSRIYNTHYKLHGTQFALALRLGDWIGGIRPYVMAGAGPYLASEDVTAELNDPDDPDHPPIDAASVSNLYMSMIYGGGLDFRFFSAGSVGIGIQYQRVLRPNSNWQFLIPTARFDYHF